MTEAPDNQNASLYALTDRLLDCRYPCVEAHKEALRTLSDTLLMADPRSKKIISLLEQAKDLLDDVLQDICPEDVEYYIEQIESQQDIWDVVL